MSRLVVASALLGWIGSTILLADLRWFSRRPLVDRLRPYAPGGLADTAGSGVLSVQSVRDVIGPLANNVGSRLARLLGVGDELAMRLERAGMDPDVTEFRVRQATWALGALVVVAGVEAAIGLPAPISVAGAFGAPLLAFCLIEQRVVAASAAWQERMTLELPVVIEQLGMLLSAGFSLGSAIARIGQRGNGVCAIELRRVTVRVRQGLSEIDALRESAARADVTAFDRLVGILSLNREAGDLGSLIAAEARNVRRDVHRQLIETIEKRGQQVWIPVTVATLVPGVIFMAVPFVDAMSKLTGR